MSRAIQTFAMGFIAAVTLSLPLAGQDEDKNRIVAIEQEYAAPAPPPGALTPMQKYMYDGPVMALTASGRVNLTSKERLLATVGRPGAGDPEIQRQTKRSDFHVELYGDTALISYSQEVTATNRRDPATRTTERTTCLDTFVKRNGNWYGIANCCSSAASPQPPVEAPKKEGAR